MGKYINAIDGEAIGASSTQKCNSLANGGAEEISQPKEFVPNLVCVVDNGLFAAAAYCYDEKEFINFTQLTDFRPKRWFTWDRVEKFAR